MLRFILNFFLFGFLFYLIYVFFPDAFHTFVSWANSVYDFFNGLIKMAMESANPKKPPATEGQQAMAFLLRTFY